MGRAEKRKQAKREGRNVKEVQTIIKEHKELKPRSFVMIVGFLIAFFVLLYLITGIFVTKDIKLFNKKNNSTEDSSSTYISNKILASNSLNQKEEEYYVYFFDSTKEDSEVKNTISLLDDKVYRVDLSDDFNSNYIGDASGVVTNIEDLKVTDPTVIKVENSVIVSFYDGVDEIKNNLS